DKPMKKIELHFASHFFCSLCERQNFVREYFVTRGDSLFLEPAEPFACKACGHRLSPMQSRGVEQGGALLCAWWFACDKCGQDNFVDKVLYVDDAFSKRCSPCPPSWVTCKSCGRTYDADVPES